MAEYQDPNIEVARKIYNGSSLLRALGFARVNHTRFKPGNEHEMLGFFIDQLLQNGFNVEFVSNDYLLSLGKDERDLATWNGNTLYLSQDLADPKNSLRAKNELAHEVGVYLSKKYFGSQKEIPMVNLGGPVIHLTHYLDNLPFYKQAA